MKLTEKQREALLAIERGEVECCNTRCGSWRIQGGSPPVVGRLVSLGLAKWERGWMGNCTITEAGLRSLAGAGKRFEDGGE